MDRNLRDTEEAGTGDQAGCRAVAGYGRLVKKYGEMGFFVQDGEMKAYKRDGGLPALSEKARALILDNAGEA